MNGIILAKELKEILEDIRTINQRNNIKFILSDKICPYCQKPFLKEYRNDQLISEAPDCSCQFKNKGYLQSTFMGQRSFPQKTFETFDEQYQSNAYQQSLQYVNEFPHKKWIILKGENGLGKTHLMAGITNEIIKKGYTALMDTTIGYADMIIEKSITIKDIKKVAFLAIDDFCLTPPRDWIRDLFTEIIKFRMFSDRPVGFTMNFGAKIINQYYNQAITQRMFGSQIVNMFPGKSFWINKEK